MLKSSASPAKKTLRPVPLINTILMDPLSIAASCGAVANVCFRFAGLITTWVQQVRHIDENTKLLGEEVRLLGNMIASVERIWRDDIIMAETRTQEKEILWGNVKDMLQGCRKTIKSLNSKLRAVTAKGKLSNTMLRKPQKQMRMAFKADDIAFYRSQIQIYQGAINISLSIFNMSDLLPYQAVPNDGSIAINSLANCDTDP